MTCRHTRSLLEDYLDQELPSPLFAEVQHHLDSCKSCKLEFEQGAELKELMKKLPVPSLSVDATEERISLILARSQDDPVRIRDHRSSTERLATAKSNFFRSLASFAMAAGVLLAAIFVGEQQPVALTDTTPDNQFYVTIDLRNATGSGSEIIITKLEQDRISRGMMIMGAPGLLGRGMELNQIMNFTD